MKQEWTKASLGTEDFDDADVDKDGTVSQGEFLQVVFRISVQGAGHLGCWAFRVLGIQG